MVRLHQLEGFFHVGVTGGYASAAGSMPYPVTAPAVYQQIRKLEAELGVLLVRQAKPRRTVLTPEGRALHEFIAPFFQKLPSVLESVKRGGAARFVVAGDGIVARELLAPALAKLRAKSPGTEVCLAERDSQVIAGMVSRGEADCGLCVLGIAERTVKEEPLLVMRISLCVPRDHPWAARRKAPERSELDGVPLCVYERADPARGLIERAFQAAGLELRVAAEASTQEGLRALVAAGIAPAFVPIARPDASRGKWVDGGVVAFDMTDLLPGEPVKIGLLTRARTLTHPAVAELRALLGKAVAQL